MEVLLDANAWGGDGGCHHMEGVDPTLAAWRDGAASRVASFEVAAESGDLAHNTCSDLLDGTWLPASSSENPFLQRRHSFSLAPMVHKHSHHAELGLHYHLSCHSQIQGGLEDE